MRRYSQWIWTQTGLFALVAAACNPGGGGGTDAASQASDSLDSSDPSGDVSTTPGASGSSEPTGTDSASGGQTGADPSSTATTGSEETSGGATESTGGETTATDGTTDDPETTGDSTGQSTTGDTGDTGDQACPLATMHLPCDADSDDPLHALGINCTSLPGDFIDGVNAVAANKIVLEVPPPSLGKRALQVARSYGSHVDPMTQQPFWGPREGDKVLLISSGLLPPPDGSGAVLIDDGDVYNDSAVGGQWDSDSMPPPMKPQKGSPDPMGFADCDGMGDCSNTIFDQWQSGGGDAEDKLWFGFELKAPAIADGNLADANGYTFDFAYFSAEFPEFVDTQYNDVFVVWQASESYTGNVVFIDEQPLTVTALWPVDFQGECDFLDPNCQGDDPHLAGTGYSLDGGATGWYRATGGVNPGETFTLTFGIFDMGDSIYDTTAILDNWAWDCEGCVPNEVDSCGIIPQ